MAVDLGLGNPLTLLQSGNLVFQSELDAAELEATLERRTLERFGLQTHCFVRSAEELAALVQANPFPMAARNDPGRLVTMFLKDAPANSQVDALLASVKGRELLSSVGRQLYIVYSDGIGNSKLTNSIIEGKLGTAGTGRNWNTVLKLQAAAAHE